MSISIERNTKTKQFFFRVKGGNGEIMTSAETYTRKASVIKALVRIAVIFNSPRFSYTDNTLIEPKEVSIDVGYSSQF